MFNLYLIWNWKIWVLILLLNWSQQTYVAFWDGWKIGRWGSGNRMKLWLRSCFSTIIWLLFIFPDNDHFWKILQEDIMYREKYWWVVFDRRGWITIFLLILWSRRLHKWKRIEVVYPDLGNNRDRVWYAKCLEEFVEWQLHVFILDLFFHMILIILSTFKIHTLYILANTWNIFVSFFLNIWIWRNNDIKIHFCFI